MLLVLAARVLRHRFSMKPTASHFQTVRDFLSASLAWRQSDLGIWHGVQSGFNVGVPALAGLLTGHVSLGFIGALCGLLFSLSDSADSLRARLFKLAQTTALILVLGLIGAAAGSHSPVFWGIFVVLLFTVGWLNLLAHPFTSPLRLGVLALISTASLPADWSMAQMLGFAALVSALTRIVGHWFFPAAPPVFSPLDAPERPAKAAATRFCLAYVLATGAGLIWGEIHGLSHPVWIATTVLLVMQPDARSSLERIMQRALGTGVGVLAAALTISLFHSSWGLLIAAIVIAYATPHGATRNYWLQSACVAWLILVLYDFAAGSQFDTHLLGERIGDVIIGCLLALGATIGAFVPIASKKSPS